MIIDPFGVYLPFGGKFINLFDRLCGIPLQCSIDSFGEKKKIFKIFFIKFCGYKIIPRMNIHAAAATAVDVVDINPGRVVRFESVWHVRYRNRSLFISFTTFMRSQLLHYYYQVTVSFRRSTFARSTFGRESHAFYH